MRSPRPKFTIRRLMIAVAILAPFLMALRDDAEGSFLAGVIIVAACVVVLAYKLTVEAIARNVANGKRLGRWRKFGIALIWSLVALVIIGSADLAFFLSYDFYLGMFYYNPNRVGHFYLQYIHLRGLVDGAISAAGVVVLARLLLWLATVLSSRRSQIKSVDQGSGDRSEVGGPLSEL